MKVTGRLPVMTVILTGLLLGMLILMPDRFHAPDTEEQFDRIAESPEYESVKERNGPKGGKLFVQDDLGLELIIQETSVSSHFRIYFYEQGRPLLPADMKVTITLIRLGRAAQLFSFRPED